MKSIQKIYNYDDNKFEFSILEEFIVEFESIYENFPLLPTIIRQMLQTNQDQRFDFKKILKALPLWEDIEIQFFQETKLMKGLPRRNGFKARVGQNLEQKKNHSRNSSNISPIKNMIYSDEQSLQNQLNLKSVSKMESKRQITNGEYLSSNVSTSSRIDRGRRDSRVKRNEARSREVSQNPLNKIINSRMIKEESVKRSSRARQESMRSVSSYSNGVYFTNTTNRSNNAPNQYMKIESMDSLQKFIIEKEKTPKDSFNGDYSYQNLDYSPQKNTSRQSWKHFENRPSKNSFNRNIKIEDINNNIIRTNQSNNDQVPNNEIHSHQPKYLNPRSSHNSNTRGRQFPGSHERENRTPDPPTQSRRGTSSIKNKLGTTPRNDSRNNSRNIFDPWVYKNRGHPVKRLKARSSYDPLIRRTHSNLENTIVSRKTTGHYNNIDFISRNNNRSSWNEFSANNHQIYNQVLNYNNSRECQKEGYVSNNPLYKRMLSSKTLKIPEKISNTQKVKKNSFGSKIINNIGAVFGLQNKNKYKVSSNHNNVAEWKDLKYQDIMKRRENENFWKQEQPSSKENLTQRVSILSCKESEMDKTPIRSSNLDFIGEFDEQSQKYVNVSKPSHQRKVNNCQQIIQTGPKKPLKAPSIDNSNHFKRNPGRLVIQVGNNKRKSSLSRIRIRARDNSTHQAPSKNIRINRSALKNVRKDDQSVFDRTMKSNISYSQPGNDTSYVSSRSKVSKKKIIKIFHEEPKSTSEVSEIRFMLEDKLNLLMSTQTANKPPTDNQISVVETENSILHFNIKEPNLLSMKNSANDESNNNRRGRSSSVFSYIKQKDKKLKPENNISRVSSYSKRKNKLKEKSFSGKRRKRGSSVKLNYKQVIRNKSKLKKPPLRRNSEKRNNLKISHEKLQKKENQIRLNLVSRRKLEHLSDYHDKKSSRSKLSSRRENNQLKSDNVHSIEFEIAGVGSVLSEDSVICDISSFKDMEQTLKKKPEFLPQNTNLHKQNYHIDRDYNPVKYETANNRTMKPHQDNYLAYNSQTNHSNYAHYNSYKAKRNSYRANKLRHLQSSKEMISFDKEGRLPGENLLSQKENLLDRNSIVEQNVKKENSDRFRIALQDFMDQRFFNS